MLNEFLTNTLQVIIVLDVAGVIAWFVLAARRRNREAAPTMAVNAATVGTPETSLWGKLTGATGSAQPVVARTSGSSLDQSLHQLRRVLESYRCSLS